MSGTGRAPARRWSAVAGVLLPIAVLVVIPLFVRRWDPPEGGISLGPWRWLGLVLLIAGGALGIWAAVLLVTRGDGTPAPWDPPQRFVVAGPYRFVRHPMMLGACAVLFGVALLAESGAIFLYWCLVVALVGWYVPAVEERELEIRFRDAYVVYKTRVPRWLPRLGGRKN
jgi:protein-S-isoprenylcysteine O-methyltransferase Ste14